MRRDDVEGQVLENAEIILRKNADYGSDNLIQTGLPGLATRLQDKVSRLRNITGNPDYDVNYESIEDTLRDIANYGVIGQLMRSGKVVELPRMVYLAGAIDLVSQSAARTWRMETARRLRQAGVASFNPAMAFAVPRGCRETAREVDAINREAIRRSGILLAYIPPEHAVFGTIREIEFARSLERRVLVVSEGLENSLLTHDLEMYTDLETAISMILTGKVDHAEPAGEQDHAGHNGGTGGAGSESHPLSGRSLHQARSA